MSKIYKEKEQKNRQVVINLEPTFHELFTKLATKEESSVSSLGRRLIIEYMIECGTLPHELAIKKLI